jgi:hypothetical protein
MMPPGRRHLTTKANASVLEVVLQALQSHLKISKPVEMRYDLEPTVVVIVRDVEEVKLAVLLSSGRCEDNSHYRRQHVINN